MAKKSTGRNSGLPSTNGNTSKVRRISTKKILSRKEKFESAKKANQAMIRVWKVISQRKTGDVDFEAIQRFCNVCLAVEMITLSHKPKLLPNNTKPLNKSKPREG